mmetsp:Transcript_64413/g.172419  ORF Transcript_64413/g.172419 Transcript_64413/m.172419 type:complete len:155 (+) Transcript_64413:3782-4246(+)
MVCGLMERVNQSVISFAFHLDLVTFDFVSFSDVFSAQDDNVDSIGAGSNDVCVRACKECARNLGRLFEALASDKRRFNKYAVHIILAFLQFSERIPGAWEEYRAELMSGVYSMVDCLGPRALQEVHGLASTSGKTIFSKIHSDYRRTFKYAGEA